MKETKIYCDVCGDEITDGWPGETYTEVPVRRAVMNHHDPSSEQTTYSHLCQNEIEPFEPRQSELFRAGDEIPMMLLAERGQFEFRSRADFPERWAKCAELLDGVWSRDQ